MKYILTLILIGILTVGCGPSTHENTTPTEKTANNAPIGNMNIASVATEGAITEDASNGGTTSPSLVMTVNPTPIILTPIQGNVPNPASSSAPLSTTGWQTYTYSALGISIDYPSEWAITEQPDGAIFTSPQGTTISLKESKTNINSNEFKIGNQHCTSRTNAHNLTATICGDTISINYSATFSIKSTDGSTQWLVLSTTTRETASVFETMFNTVRLNQ